MCEISSKVIENPDGTRDAWITCSISGKPISTSNEYGMFCEDLCGLEDMKKLPGPEDFKKLLANLPW